MFNFNFGKKKPDRNRIVLVGVVLSGIVATLSQCTGAPQERLWDLLDEVQRRFFPQTIINDVLLQDPDVVKRRVKRDVDRAIAEYERLTRDSEPPIIPLPRFIEKEPEASKCYTKECKALGGEIRMCAPWVPDCTGGSEWVDKGRKD
jgi:hypothetical protein